MSSKQWSALEVLAEPTRRRVFETVRAADEPLTRENVAERADIGRRLAAFHLDVLTEAGLLAADYARAAGRTGPGAGRPAKRYRVVPGDITVSMPQRRYDIPACILARAVNEAGAGEARRTAMQVAYDEGFAIGREHRRPGRLGVAATLDAAAETLAELGYEPQRTTSRCVRLGNCPFHAVKSVAVELVCTLNDRFVSGVLDGLGGHESVTSAPDGASPNCCVTVARR